MKGRSLALIAIFLLLAFASLSVYLNNRIKLLERKIIDSSKQKNENIQILPSIPSESSSDKEKIVIALTDDKVKEEVRFLDNYQNWPIYTSKIDIKFRYPKNLGCSENRSWEIKDDSEEVRIYTCDGFAGTFSDAPYYEIRKTTGKESLERRERNPNAYSNKANDGTKFIQHEIFGLLYEEQGEEVIGSWIKYLPDEIHTLEKGEYTGFKFILHQLNDYPVAVNKMIQSVRLADYSGEF